MRQQEMTEVASVNAAAAGHAPRPRFVSFTGLAKAALALALALSLSGVAAAQDESDETKKLKDEVELLKLQKEKAELEKDLLAAKFPMSSTKPLEGKTTVDDNAFLESEMLSYRSMATLAGRISDEINQRLPGMTSMAVYNERDIKLLLSYKAVNDQIELMRAGYNEIIKPPPAAPEALTPTQGINVVTSVLGSFVDLLALFRTDTEIKGKSFTIKEAALVAEVFRELRAKYSNRDCPSFYYPAAFPPDENPSKESRILTAIQDLFILKARAEEIISLEEIEKKVKALKAEVATLETALDAKQKELAAKENELKSHMKRFGSNPRGKRGFEQDKLSFAVEQLRKEEKEIEQALGEKRGELKKQVDAQKEQSAKINDGIDKDQAILKLKALNSSFEKFVADLTKVDDSAGINALTAYIKAENLKDAMERRSSGCKAPADTGGEGYWLQLEVLRAGGNNKTRRNFFDIFTGNKLSHSGGTIIQYMVYDTKGSVKLSDTKTDYQDYVGAGKIPEIASQNQCAAGPCPKKKEQKQGEKSGQSDLAKKQ